MLSFRVGAFLTNCLLSSSRCKLVSASRVVSSRNLVSGSDACCSKGTPSRGDYLGKGTVKQVKDVKVYEVGTGPKTILVAYDIFGFEVGNTRHFCDELASSGYRILMPDYFRGKPFLPENFPPSSRQVLLDFAQERGNEKIVRETSETVLQAYNVSQFGMVGFCWGAKQMLRFSGDKRCRIGVSVHGSFFENGDADHVAMPIFFIIAGDDMPIDPLKQVIDKKKVGAQCVYKYYPTMSHGWCAARGDWNKPDVGAAAFEVINLSKDFLRKHF